MDWGVVLISAIFIWIMGLVVGYSIGAENALVKYKTCRHYDQTIERCITELGWEKK